MEERLDVVVFDTTISLGNILTAVGTVGGVMYAYHNWDKRVEIRHIRNLNEFESLSGKIDRVESKVDETRKDVNGSRQKLVDLGEQVRVHQAQDEIIQKEIVRRLDRIDDGQERQERQERK